MGLKRFEFFDPASLPEALSLLRSFDGRGKAIAGGTDLLVRMKNGFLSPEKIVNLLNVPELKGFSEKDGELSLGALTTHDELAGSGFLGSGREVLSRAAETVGSPQIRTRGTLGGNLCNASPSADTAPALLALNAEVSLAGHEGLRRLPLEEFFTGPGETALRPGEILKEILLPCPPPRSRGAYLKLGRRKSLDLSLAGIAVLLSMGRDGKTCLRARIALGGVAPTPVRAKEAEKILEGAPLEENRIREAARAASRECRPITDIRASAAYRLEMVRVLTERAVKKCLEPGGLADKLSAD